MRNTHPEEKLLWRPSESSISESRLAEFIQYINDKHNTAFSINDYEGLHHWSISERALFWESCWDFFGIIHSQAAQETLTSKNFIYQDLWFSSAKLNFAENLLNAGMSNPEKLALKEWNEHGLIKSLSYQELMLSSQSLAQTLKKQGIQKGDRVAACVANTSEAVIGMLATSSIGAIWSSCSPDFGVQGMADRFTQIEPKALLCCQSYQYNGKVFSISENISRLVKELPSLKLVISIENKFSTDTRISADHIQHLNFSDCLNEAVQDFHYEQLEFNHPLYIMFSSGTTGMPKCIVHGCGGTLLQHMKEHQLHCNLKSNDVLFFFTTCGWMMWNWLVSALASKATIILYDGSPFFPKADTLFDLAEQENLTHMGLGAKFISAIEKENLQPIKTHQLPALRVLLSTGSPLSQESFHYVYRSIKDDLNLASISGGTDIISCFALGNPALPVYAGEIQCNGLGMDVDVFNEDGDSIQEEKGELVCKQSFPSMPIGFWNDENKKKYLNAYFSHFDNIWAHGDFAEITAHQGIIIHGRSDAVLNPGGVRIGTAEIYRQVEKVDEVLESVVIGQQWQDDTRLILFVVLKESLELNKSLISKIKQSIRENATPRHVPALIFQVPEIPRTKSGKIVELAVRSIVHGEEVKNTEALANPEALEYFKELNYSATK